jgi:hypothetical protein
MTEEEWFATLKPNPMVTRLLRSRYHTTHRKFRFFALACSRAAWPVLVEERSRRAVDVAERFLAGMVTEQQFVCAIDEARVAREETFERYSAGDPSRTRPDTYAASMAAWVAYRAVAGEYHLDMIAKMRDSLVMHGRGDIFGVLSELADALRDIFGNPFRPVSFDPEWYTSSAVAIAQGMYESRDFSPMPILADALQDAGCDNADILDHCRGEGPHVRGCWVVDAVLGKE